MGTDKEHPVPDWAKQSFCNFWHPDTDA